ncbi:TIGR03758 family integrating conjugative element protein [Pseudomonas fluorescens]|uniref:TIGR03758 family integrating conjugative element protein n=1 Tax=Pseudomonas fluorescens TaxID=294 RepID=UPI00177C9610|nr:TIGR03758 family integrating conjugative element protein [Pseudomonas fluorescens]
MSPAQISAFQANSGITPADVATVLLGAVFAALLVWGVWALRSAYVGWAEEQLSQRQFLVVVVRVVVLYLALTFFLLS